jgi:choline dehydrogenase-like flavoprotein
LQDLAPYYEQAEHLLGVRPVECEPDLARILRRIEAVDPGWRARRIPLGLAPEISSDRAEASHFDGFASVRQLKGDAEHSLLSKLEGNDRFFLLVNTEATALLSSEEIPGAVGGVRLADGREIFARRVFLAAGALHSPRLLSRYLQSAGLQEKLPAAAQVGRHLKFHLLTAVISVSLGRKTDLIRKTALLTHDRFPHSSVQPLGFDAELMQTLLPRVLPPRVRRQISHRAYGFFLQTEDGSDERNAVQEATTSSGLPILNYDSARLPVAAHEHTGFVASFRATLGRSGMLTGAQRIGLEGTAHACGSLVCGRDPATSVVAPDGRVHGLKGIYVVDGSVLPRSSRVNPSLTIYAWGLRIGELVVSRWRHEQQSPDTQAQAHVV